MFNKYHAKKTEVQGIKFDSKKEASRYLELQLLLKAGAISELKRQVPYLLIDSHRRKDGKLERKCEYIADFVYVDNAGNTIVEDVKGFRGGAAYQIFIIKRKLMLDRYGIEIKEI